MSRTEHSPADATGPLAIGMDVGGTKTAIVVTDERDRLFAEETVPTDAGDLPDQLIALVRGTVERLEAPPGSVAAVGLAVPGHVVADPDGPVCACGLRGCLEAVAAGPAIARLAQQRYEASGTALPNDVTAGWVFAAASRGGEIAAGVVAPVAGHLARAIRARGLGYGVDRVVIGGGVAAAGDALVDPILSAIAQERRVSPLIDAAFSVVSIDVLPPELKAGARGAAAIARGTFPPA
jgi:predicted NBD/HSP70 family sugar kinase